MPRKNVKQKHNERHSQGGKEARAEHGCSLLHLPGKVRGDKIAEEGVRKDRNAVFDGQRDSHAENRREDYHRLGKKDYPHNYTEEEERERVKKQRSVVRH